MSGQFWDSDGGHLVGIAAIVLAALLGFSALAAACNAPAADCVAAGGNWDGANSQCEIVEETR